MEIEEANYVRRSQQKTLRVLGTGSGHVSVDISDYAVRFLLFLRGWEIGATYSSIFLFQRNGYHIMDKSIFEL